MPCAYDFKKLSVLSLPLILKCALVFLTNDTITLPLNYQEPQERDGSQSRPCTSALYSSRKRGFYCLGRGAGPGGSSAEQGWVGRPDPPGAPGSPGPPRPGPHLRGMVPGAGLRRAQLCRTNRLRMPLLGPHSSCPALEKPFRKSYLHLPRPKLQGRGRPQSLKTLHRIAKGSSAWTQ